MKIWCEKLVFSHQVVYILNPFIMGCPKNWRKNTILITSIAWKVKYESLWNSNFNVKKKIIIGHICYSKQNLFTPHPTHNFVWIKTCPIICNCFHVNCYLKIMQWSTYPVFQASRSLHFFEIVFDMKKDNNWSYLLFKTKFVYSQPHKHKNWFE